MFEKLQFNEETRRLLLIVHDTIFSNVFTFLDNNSQTTARLVSKSWNQIINDKIKNDNTTEENKKENLPIIQFIVVGNLENRRVALFQSAVIDLQNPPAKLISWETVLQNMLDHSDDVNIAQWQQLLKLRSSCSNNSGRPVKFVIRVDSPGENWEVEKRLLELGSDEMYNMETSGMRIRRADIQNLQFDKGAIKYQRQWYLGLKEALLRLYNHVKAAVDCSDVPINYRYMNHPKDILVMFDKRICWGYLKEHNIPLPKAILDVESYDDLKRVINRTSMDKVFVKLAHGSSASGVVAFACILDSALGPTHSYPYTEVGTTSVELERSRTTPNAFNLYNSLRIRRYTRTPDLRDIIDTLCGEKVIVEEWVPKAKYEDRNFDLRIVVINGNAEHFVVRTSQSPMTNLHLGNARGDNQVFLELINSKAPGSWEKILATCSRLAKDCFPDSWYMGIDVLITPDFRDHYILEVNAFGDLIPRIYDSNNMDTYHAQVKAFLDQQLLRQLAN